MHWSDRFKRCVQPIVRILDIRSWQNEKPEKISSCNNVSSRPLHRRPCKQTLLIKAAQKHPLQLSHMQKYYSKLVYFHVIFLWVKQEESVTSCSSAVSAQFTLNCDFSEPGLMSQPGHDSDADQQQIWWFTTILVCGRHLTKTSCPGLCIKECISVIRISAGAIMLGGVCDFRFDTAGYDIRLCPIRQDGMDGRDRWTNAEWHSLSQRLP